MRKAILWIDDFDNNSSHARKKPGLNNEKKERQIKIFKEWYSDQVILKEKFYDGIKYIIEHHGEYDCVILDVDLNRNFGNINREDSVWKKFYKYVNVREIIKKENGKILGYIGEEPSEIHLSKYAGYYLVILLLMLGFPRERMIMFTAYGNKNSDDPRVKIWEEKFNSAGLQPPMLIDKGVDWQSKIHVELNRELDMRYSSDNRYYQTRLLVLKMCNFVKMAYNNNKDGESYSIKQLKQLNEFNSKIKENDKRLNPEQVMELYDNIANAFTINKPTEYSLHKFLYQSLKQFSEPFEADYDPKESDSDYRVAKLFRNWSSHSRFNDNEEMLPDYFVFLFLLESVFFINKSNLEDVQFMKILRMSCVYDENIQVQNIVSKVELADWNTCKANDKYKQVPYNMIDVLHVLGNKKKTEYEIRYKDLWDAFIGSCCEKNIEYVEKSIQVKYSLKELSEVQMILIKYAYYLWDKS